MRVLIGIMMVGFTAVVSAAAATVEESGGVTCSCATSAPCIPAQSPGKPDSEAAKVCCANPVDTPTLVAICVLGALAAVAFIARAHFDKERHLDEAQHRRVQAGYEAAAKALALALKEKEKAGGKAGDEKPSGIGDLIREIRALSTQIESGMRGVSDALKGPSEPPEEA